MKLMSTNGEKIILGSGKLYVTEYGDSIPDDAVIEAAGNLLGYIQGGATLSYKPTFYLAEDDLGLVKKQILTKEEVSLKSGVMTWNGDTLKRLVSTARVTENGVTNKRLVKIGGVSNQDGKRYIVRFVHEDATDGDVRVTIIGGNQGELALSFAKDKETVIDAEFMAIPHDTEGTLVLFEEDIAGLVTLTVTSVAGTTTGKTAITVVPALDYTNTYVYKTGSSLTLPAFNDDLSTGWTAWDGVAEITATTGQEIAIAEVDGANLCQAAGKTTVVAKA
jgi:hypothetical protein